MKLPSRLFVAIALGVLPIVITLLLVTFYMRTTLSAAIPTGSDEIDYWHEIKTFSEVGFNSGYYTYEETSAPASFTHFGAHGPVFIGVIGLLAKLTGWHYSTMTYYNFAIIFIALVTLVYAIPWTRRQFLALFIMIGSCWGLLLFLPLTMQETTHFAIAILAACIFYQQLANPEPLSLRFKVLAILFFVAAGLIRSSWTFLVLPLLLLDTGNQTRSDYLKAIVLAGAVIAIPFFLFVYLSAPYPLNFSRVLLRVFTRSPLEGISVWIQYFVLNMQRLRLGYPLEVINRYQILLLLMALALGFLATRLPRRSIISRWFKRLSTSSREVYFHWLNLGFILFAQLLLYDVFHTRDYRIFAPHLLLSLLLLLALNRMLLTWGMLAIAVLCTVFFLQTYDAIAHNIDQTLGRETASRYEISAQVESFEQTTAGLIVYTPDPVSGWCNTIFTYDFYPELLTLPAGIGITTSIDTQNFERQPQSRYLLLRDEDLAPLLDYIEVEPLTTTNRGTLYLNLNAACD